MASDTLKAVKYTAALDAALAQYAELQQRAADMDAMELDDARHTIRPDKERETAQRLQAAHGKKFDSGILAQSRKDVAGLLGEEGNPLSIQEKLRQLHRQPKQQCHRKEYGQER